MSFAAPDRTGRRPAHLAPAWLFAALIAPAAAGQGPPEPAQAPAASAPVLAPVADLTVRYRLSERYAQGDDTANGAIGVARVGVVEVVKDSVDLPKGAPRRTEIARQLVYLERPVDVSAQGVPAASIRAFERYQVQPSDAAEAVSPRPFEGLTAWCRPRAGENPLWLSLTEGRRLRDGEFEVASRTAFLPQAAGLLPALPVRVGDTWRVPRRAAQALLGENSGPIDGLTGKLTEILREPEGGRLVAVIGLSGRADGAGTSTAVNAEARFTGQVEPAAAPAVVPTSLKPTPAARPAAGNDTLDVRGAITDVRLARSLTGLLPGPGRLHYRTNREVVIQRQVGLAADVTSQIPRPAQPIVPTAEAAVLVYLDPQGRFRFDHPQDLLPPDPYHLIAGGITTDPETTTFTRARRDGHDLLQIEMIPRIVGPETLRSKMAAKWGTGRVEVLKGGETWLPEADWPGMKVHRIEAAIKAPERAAAAGGVVPRIHFDGYLIQFSQKATVLAVATTSRDDVAAYRREIEAILHTLSVNPGRPVEG